MPAIDRLHQHTKLDIDLDTSTDEEGALRDSLAGKQGYGIFIGDFKIRFTLGEGKMGIPSRDDIIILPILSKQTQDGAF